MGNCLAPSKGGGVPKSGQEARWARVEHSPLTQSEIVKRVHTQSGESVRIGDHVVDYYALSFRGYYPDTPNKANQDEFAVLTPEEWGQPARGLFGVFDGHGQVGDKCAIFAASMIPKSLKAEVLNLANEDAITAQVSNVFTTVNTQLHAAREIDDDMSGTTAVTAIFLDNTIWVANVGDSRCIIISDEGGGHSVKALSMDQTPYRRDERARVIKCGARVMNVDQLEGFEPIHDDWDMSLGDEVDEGGDPPRIWAPDGPYPGTAFTRSIGDRVAEDLGVSAEPEMMRHEIASTDKLLIVASDGVWEFLTNKEAMHIVTSASNCMEASRALWKAAYTHWITKESRTDDITVVIVDLGGFYNPDAAERNTTTPRAPSESNDVNVAPILNRRARRGSTKLEIGRTLNVGTDLEQQEE